MSPTDTSYMTVRSRFDYGVGGGITILTMALPVRPWDTRKETIGGRRIASGGQGASHIVRVDQIVVVPLRFPETAEAAVLGLIDWGQTEETFTWFPDANDVGTSFLVYLQSPAAGIAVAPIRMQDFPKVKELSIELRRADQPSVPWGLDYFGSD